MIAFYHVLTDCFITAESDPSTARRAALLLSAKTTVFNFRTKTARNLHVLGNDVMWHEWTLSDSGKWQDYWSETLDVRQPQEKIQKNILIDLYDVERFVPSDNDEKSRGFALKIKETLEVILHWTKFIEWLRPSPASDFISQNQNLKFDTPHEKELRDFIRQCENNLYLSNTTSDMNRENFILLKLYKKNDQHAMYAWGTPWKIAPNYV